MPLFCRTELRKAAQHPETYGYWILYAKGRDTNLKEEKISKEDYERLINFADRVDSN
jgi:hypothetical protein